MATLGATVCPEPVGVVPCLAWSSASLTFTRGVMTDAIPWPLLQHQYQTTETFKSEISKMCATELNAFRAGQDFVKNMDYQETGKTDSRLPFNSIVDSLNIPFVFSSKLNKQLNNPTNGDQKDQIRRESLGFMRGIMDECTHLKNFAIPVAPEFCIAVAAELDAYQPREGVRAIPEIWPGSQIRFIKGEGHVSSYLLKQGVFREAIYDVLDLMQHKTSQSE